MTNRTITGNIYEFGGGSTSGDTVTIYQREPFSSSGTVYQSGATSTTADGSGNWSISVPVPSSGSVAHRVIFPSGDSFDYYISLGDGSSVNIATLITATGSPATGDIYEPVLGNPASNGYVLSSTTAGVRSWVAQSSGVTDHGALTGLADDDHTQYLNTTRHTAITGNPHGTTAGQIDVTGGVYTGETIEAALDLIDGTFQPTSNALSQISGLTLANDDIIQQKVGVLTNRTMAQLLSDLSAKLNAINALTWAANSIIQLTSTSAAAVVTLASHVWTFLQSADAAAARSAIGAGTGNGDVVGPASSTDNVIPRFDGTTGKLLQQGTNAPRYTDAGYIDSSTGYIFGGNTDKGLVQDAGGPNVFWVSSFTSFGVKLWNGSAYLSSHLFRRLSGVAGSAQTVIPNGAGDVTLGLSGTYTISDGAGNFDGGVIDPTTPGNNFNLFDDGGTNTCQLQVAADGSVTVIRTAGSRTYAVNLTLNWM